MGKIQASNYMYFTDDELGPNDSRHNKPLYITVRCKDVLVGKELIDNGYAWNMPNNWNLGSGIVRGAINVPGDIVGDEHSSILHHIIGKIMDPYGWSSSFLIVAGGPRCRGSNKVLSCLLRRCVCCWEGFLDLIIKL